MRDNWRRIRTDADGNNPTRVNGTNLFPKFVKEMRIFFSTQAKIPVNFFADFQSPSLIDSRLNRKVLRLQNPTGP